MIADKDGRIVPVHGDHHPVEVYAARESRNLLDPAARLDTYANVRFHYPLVSTDGLTLRAGKTYTLVVFPGNYDRPSGVYFNRNIGAYKTENLAKKYDSYSVSFTPTTDVENVSTDAYWSAGHEPSDVSAVKIMLFEGVGDVPYEPYGTVTDTIFKPTLLKKSGTEVTFEKSYNHTAEVEVQGKSDQVRLTGKNLVATNMPIEIAPVSNPSTVHNSLRPGVWYSSFAWNGYSNASRVHDVNASDNEISFMCSNAYGPGAILDLEPGKNYTLSYQASFSGGKLNAANTHIVKISNGVFSGRVGGTSTKSGAVGRFMFTAEAGYQYMLIIASGGSDYETDEGTITYTNLQIEEGSTATPYEPYCGGIPSPNPDYPQPIESIEIVKLVVKDGKGIVGREWSHLPEKLVKFKLPKTVKAGDVFTVASTGDAPLSAFGSVYLYTNYEDVTRNDYWSLPAVGSMRRLIAAYDFDAIAWIPTNERYIDVLENNTYCIFAYGDVSIDDIDWDEYYDNLTTRTIDLQGNKIRSVPDGTHDTLLLHRDGRVEYVKRTEEKDIGDIKWTCDSWNCFWAAGALPGAPQTAISLVVGSSLTSPGYESVDRFKPSAGIKNWTYVALSPAHAKGAFGIKDERFENFATGAERVAAFKAAMAGETIVYKIETPQTITLPSIDPLPTYWPTTVIYDSEGNDISCYVKVID